jgi:hypothetical protein
VFHGTRLMIWKLLASLEKVQLKSPDIGGT